MSFLSEHMSRLADSVRAQAERARAGSGHSGIKGAAIEVVLRNLLRQYVPTTFSIGTGQFANATGDLSPQLDVLVYDAAVFPHLSVNEDGSVVVCGESVFAVTECKARWDAEDVANHFRRFCDVELKCCGPWEAEGPDDRERAAYFAFMLEAPATPDVTVLEDANRAVGVYGLTGGTCWYSPRGQAGFTEHKGNALELFLSHVLQDCMEKGQSEVGTFGDSYQIVRRYFGWRGSEPTK
jgi:hypothetical protein